MLELAFLSLPLLTSDASEWQSARRGSNSVLVYKAASGRGSRPILSIECRQGITSVTVYWPQLVGAPTAQPVTYTIDYQSPRVEYWRRTDDRRSLGLWGAPSINLSKRLTGKSQITVYARTKSNEIMHAQFNLVGLDRAIDPVKQACRWGR